MALAVTIRNYAVQRRHVPRRRQQAQAVTAIDNERAIDRLKAMPPAVVKKVQADDAGLMQNYCQEAPVGALARDDAVGAKCKDADEDAQGRERPRRVSPPSRRAPSSCSRMPLASATHMAQ